MNCNIITFRWRLVGCMYWPSVRQSTPASRSSATTPQQNCQDTVFNIDNILSVSLYMWLGRVHTSQGGMNLLVSLPKSQHDGGLGKQSGFDLFGVLQDAQRLVKVRSGVSHMPGADAHWMIAYTDISCIAVSVVKWLSSSTCCPNCIHFLLSMIKFCVADTVFFSRYW